MGDLVKYGSFDLDEVESAEKDLARRSGNYLKLPEGRTVLRVVAPKSGTKALISVKQHHIVLPNQTRAIFNCPQQMLSLPCPACQQGNRMGSTGRQADKEKARKFWPKLRVFANVIDRSNPEAGVQVLGFGRTIYEQLLSIRKETGVDFTNPESGHDIIIVRKGMSETDTDYKVMLSPKPSALGNLEWIDMQGDLTKQAEVLSYDAIMAKLGNGPADPAVDGPQGGAVGGQYMGTGRRLGGRTAADDALGASED
jgi:hypothetical protein